jgi:RND family efflux transporter MFP subunit
VQLREAELAYRSAELEVDQAQIDLSQRSIMAPISGWVGLLDVEQGDRIGTQDVIAVITDRSSIQIEFRVPERYIAELSVGMPITVTPLARPDDELAGEIVALDNVVERASRTLRVQARVPNADDSLRVGQAFEVALSFPGEDLPAVDPLAIQWSSTAPSSGWRETARPCACPSSSASATPTRCWSRARWSRATWS